MSNYDVLVVLAVSGAIQLSCLAFLAWLVRSESRHMAGMLTECQRLTRAVGVLVIQEEDKTRALFRQQS